MYKLFDRLTPLSILALICFGLALYYFLFPGFENWGLLTAYFLGLFGFLIITVDFVMRFVFKNKRLNIKLQILILILAILWYLIKNNYL